MKRKVAIIISIIFISFYNNIYSSGNDNKINNDSINTIAEDNPTKLRYGFYTGWKSSYGTGIEISLLSKRNIDFGIGAGLSTSGFKVGLGTRIYLSRITKVSPLIGAYFFYSSGVNPLNVSVNGVEAVYKINSNSAVVLNTGLRFNIHKKAKLITCIGYSLPFNNERAIYLSGSKSTTVRSFADNSTAGGISFTIGLLRNF